MQLLDLCILDEMIYKENMETLIQLHNYLKISRLINVIKFFFIKINKFLFLEKYKSFK